MFIVAQEERYLLWDPQTGRPTTGILSRPDVIRCLSKRGFCDPELEDALRSASHCGVGSYLSRPAPSDGYLKFRTGRVSLSAAFDVARVLGSAEPERVDEYIVH